MILFSVHTVEFSAINDPAFIIYHHPEEVWDILLEHVAVDFQDCPDVQELWLCTEKDDQIMIWERA